MPLSGETCIGRLDSSKRTESEHSAKPPPIIQAYKWPSCSNVPRAVAKGPAYGPLSPLYIAMLFSYLAWVSFLP